METTYEYNVTSVTFNADQNETIVISQFTKKEDGVIKNQDEYKDVFNGHPTQDDINNRFAVAHSQEEGAPVVTVTWEEGVLVPEAEA